MAHQSPGLWSRQASIGSLGRSGDGGGLTWREEELALEDPQVHKQTDCASAALGAGAQHKEKVLMEGRGKSGSKAIPVLEDRCSGSSGPTLEFRRRRRGMKAWDLRRQTSGCRDRSWRGGWADLHVVWGCRAHFNQGLCSADASGRSSCQSSRFPSDVGAAPHRPASLAPLQPLTYTLVHE